MKQVLFVVWVLSVLVSSIHAFVGVVERHSGQAFVLRSAKTIKVYNGLKLKKKDTIKTKKNAWVKLRLNDNTVINAGQNAKLVIQEYLYTEKSNSKASFSFVKGLFRTITGKIGKVAPAQFKVHTPNATIGIRGTEFYVDISQKSEKVLCTRGAIFVSSALGEIEVEAGRQMLMNGTQYKIQRVKLNRIKKAVGIPISRATPKERALIGRRNAGAIISRPNQNNRLPREESTGQNSAIEQENTTVIDNPIPEVPPHNPCPAPS